MLYIFATKVSLLKWPGNFSLLVCQVLSISSSTQKDVDHCAQWYVHPIIILNESSSWLVVIFGKILCNMWQCMILCAHLLSCLYSNIVSIFLLSAFLVWVSKPYCASFISMNCLLWFLQTLCPDCRKVALLVAVWCLFCCPRVTCLD